MIDKMMENLLPLLSKDSNSIESKRALVNLYNYILRNPHELDLVYNCNFLGKLFLLMIEKKITNDPEHLDKMANLGYLFLSMGISKYPNISDVIRDGILLLNHSKHYLIHTVEYAKSSTGEVEILPILSNPDRALKKIEFYLFNLDNNIKNFSNYFSNRWNELEKMFNSDKNKYKTEGKIIDAIMREWLEYMVFVEEDLNF